MGSGAGGPEEGAGALRRRGLGPRGGGALDPEEEGPGTLRRGLWP